MRINGLTEEQKNKLTELMQKKIESGTANGAALCILQNGKELYRENFGFADKEAGRLIQNDTVYRLFSMTKPIVSVATHILIERGLLAYNEPVYRYLPAFRDQKVLVNGELVPVKKAPTIQDLLNMSAGAYYPDGNEIGQLYGAVQDKINAAFDAGKPYTTREVADMLGALPLGFEPGTHWNYSTCADILGAVIEVVSGKKLGVFLANEIFKPLGMVDTGFRLPEKDLSRYTVMYDWPNAEHPALWPHEVSIFCVQPRYLENSFESGGAGLVSTVDDYARFVQMLLNGGEYEGVRILRPETVKTMLTPTLAEAAKADLTWDSLKGYTYTNLFRILESTEEVGYNGAIGEFGWDGWTGNFFFGDPENKIVFLYFVQLCGGGDVNLMHELARVIYNN